MAFGLVVVHVRGAIVLEIQLVARRGVEVELHHLAYELTDLGLSLPTVGRLLGRHHTTVMDSRRRWAAIVGDVGPTVARVEPRRVFRHPSTVMGGGR
jgi:hypothetical protein